MVGKDELIIREFLIITCTEQKSLVCAFTSEIMFTEPRNVEIIEPEIQTFSASQGIYRTSPGNA